MQRRQLVDLFRLQDSGVFFFPVLGLVCAQLITLLLELVSLGAQRLIGGHTVYGPNESASDPVFAALLGLALVGSLHLARRDSLLPAVAAPLMVVAAVLARGLAHGLGSLDPIFYSPDFYSHTGFLQHVVGPRTLLFSAVDAALLSAALVFFHRRFQRLMPAAVAGYATAAIGGISVFGWLTRAGEGASFGTRAFWDVRYLVIQVIEGACFSAAYTLQLRSGGWNFSANRLERTHEGLGARNPLLPTRRLVTAFAVLSLLDAICLAVALPGTVRRMDAMTQEIPAAVLSRLDTAALAATILGVMIAVAIAVLTCVILYRGWTVLQDGKTRTSPGTAVGLLFVPLFNLYWLFRVTHGLAREYNAFVSRHELRVPPLPTSVFLAAPILTLAEGVLGWVLRLSQADVIFPDQGTYSTLVAATAVLSATASAVWCACVFLVCQAGSRVPSEKFGRQSAATEGA